MHFTIEVSVAFDAPSDDEAELDGVGNERGNPKVGLLKCDKVCWFGCGVGDDRCFGFALAGTEGQRVY